MHTPSPVALLAFAAGALVGAAMAVAVWERERRRLVAAERFLCRELREDRPAVR